MAIIYGLFSSIWGLNKKTACRTLGMVKQALTLDLRHQREMGHPMTPDPRETVPHHHGNVQCQDEQNPITFGPLDRCWNWRLSCELHCNLAKPETSAQGGKDLTSALERRRLTTAKLLPDTPPKSTQGFRKAIVGLRVAYTGSCTLARAFFCGKPPWQTNAFCWFAMGTRMSIFEILYNVI